MREQMKKRTSWDDVRQDFNSKFDMFQSWKQSANEKTSQTCFTRSLASAEEDSNKDPRYRNKELYYYLATMKRLNQSPIHPGMNNGLKNQCCEDFDRKVRNCNFEAEKEEKALVPCHVLLPGTGEHTPEVTSGDPKPAKPTRGSDTTISAQPRENWLFKGLEGFFDLQMQGELHANRDQPETRVRKEINKSAGMKERTRAQTFMYKLQLSLEFPIDSLHTITSQLFGDGEKLQMEHGSTILTIRDAGIN
ncbi:hypothetical protein WISP_135227 [Willisornis vidua]|uniref:Uncharacterized protein n=1 Tax=Willisornis vidua TaxID=1566151 RepID=A0ABQ9CNI1_9PASS|nr:hypothetical protein WISP_135227 [Willisornis vidua]